MQFDELNLSPEVLAAVKDAGFEEATPIQAETIPLVKKGVDVIGQAQTGTGKTAAFGLPIIDSVDTSSKYVQALIISPTRELAIQTQEELSKLGRKKHVKVQAVYGGADIRKQINGLKNHPQIVVGTPGRILDHIKRKTLDLSHVKTVVLDEADEMLDMGFITDIESILESVPNDHQTLLFSATMPKPILRISDKFMKSPEIVKIKSSELTANKIDQYFVKCKEFEKFDLMTRLFDVQKPEVAIIFGRTKRRVDELTRGLKARGYNAEGLHGDLSQQKRMTVLRSFKAKKLQYLVATDVAARGLDISGVSHVYNYDIPQDPDSYVHRIGRTGRAGKSGTSVTFVAPNEMGYLKSIEKLTNKRMTTLQPPTKEEAFAGRTDNIKDEIEKTVQNTDLSKYSDLSEELLEKYDPKTLVAAYLSTVSKDHDNVTVKITAERPLPNKGFGGVGRRGRGGGYRKNNNGGGHHNKNGKRGGYNSRGRNHGSSDNSNYKKKNNNKNVNRSNKSDSGKKKSSEKRNFVIRTKS